MRGGGAQFVDDVRVGPIEHPHEDRLPALNDDAEDRSRDEQADDRVGKRVAQPYAGGAEEHGQAGPAVDTRMVSVRDQGRAVDLLADADPEHRNRLVAEKADDRGRHHRAQIGYVLGMQEPIDALIPGDDRARENRQYDGDPGQVLDAPITEGKASARLLAREPECDRQRDRSRGVAEIMNCIGQQRHAAGDEDHDQLQRGRDRQTRERPFDRPQSPPAGGDRGVDDAMRMAMTMRRIMWRGRAGDQDRSWLDSTLRSSSTQGPGRRPHLALAHECAWGGRITYPARL